MFVVSNAREGLDYEPDFSENTRRGCKSDMAQVRRLMAAEPQGQY